MEIKKITNSNQCFFINTKQIPFKGFVSFNNADNYIKNNNIGEIKKISDTSITSHKQETLLHLASKYNQAEIADFLLNKGLNPNIKNNHGKTPFSIACSKNNNELIRKFLNYDIDINTQDNWGNTPLHKVIKNPQNTRLLLEYGANPNIKNIDGETAYSLSYHYPSSLKTFLNYGINPNTEIENSKTLMHKAISNNNLEIATILKEHSADVNYKDNRGNSPIFYAQDTNTINWLINNEAKINTQNNKKQTVIHQAVINNNTSLLKEFLKHNPNINLPDEKNLTPLAYSSKMSIFKLLLQNGANPNIKTKNGKMILLNQVMNNNLETVYYLLEANANPNIVDEKGYTPLDYAHNNDIRTLLLANGADPNYKNYLIYALQTQNKEFFDNLLEVGADTEKQNNYGKTPVFYINSEEELLKLKNYGANLNHIDNNGITPILHFTLKNNKKMVELLKNNGAKEYISQQKESLESAYSLYETYHTWLNNKKPTKNISFNGINSYDFYGTDRERHQLNYKPILTKEKINSIMEKPEELPTKLATIYKLLKNEEKNIFDSMNALSVVLKHYNYKFKLDLQEMFNANPACSKIPLAGIISQLCSTVFSNSFLNKLEEKFKKSATLLDEIVEQYYTKNIRIKLNHYEELLLYLNDGLKYLSYMEDNNQLINTYRNKLSADYSKCTTKAQLYVKNIENLGYKYINLFDKVIEHQTSKQTKRTTKKIVLLFLGGGS